MDRNKGATKPTALDEKKKPVLKKKKSTYFDKVTHLFLQEKCLVKIPKISSAQSIETVYLYNNKIKTIENLHELRNLSNLYLQNNQIDKVENLSHLSKLKNIYLGKNRISVLEGLQCIDGIEELHVEKQDLPDNCPMCFDPRTVLSLSNTLRVLNISHNKIISLEFLSPLKMLVILDASHNDFDNMQDVCQTLRNWLHLKEAKFNGNPISSKHRYREDIIANSHCLEKLDNKKISEVSRRFIKSFEKAKLLRKAKVNLADIVPSLPTNYPVSLQKAASASIIKEFRCKQLDNQAETLYLTWNSLPKRSALTKPTMQLGHKMESQKNIVVSKSTIKMRRP
ncbi:unnamed protein product [Ceutorhynchus assimilis]|uniref:Protein phosphatase 1 regulatory subunit 42 n=1 Tax=Ceutorhynchus assimilis TaxID=467358 RepID=A0A9N9MCZ3_9CUCU|nr:unnamed protein product [Ceutorhynchus assimilis]